MGVLLFQDLAVVAFLILIPALAGTGGGDSGSALGARAASRRRSRSRVILFLGQRPMRAWFHLVARQRSPELFVLNVLLVTLGLAALTELAGLSLALGAFLAGMLISETEYRYQVEEDIKPFRDVLLGLFFITIGMMLDLRRWPRVHAVRLARAARRPGAAKLVLIVAARARCSARRSRTALRTGFYLAQAGEFALVLLSLALAHRPARRRRFMQIVLAAMVLSMLLAPLLIQYAEPMGAQADRQRLARARRRGDAGRGAHDGAAGSRDRLRLRPQRPEPRRGCSSARTSRTSRSTPTRSACARRRDGTQRRLRRREPARDAGGGRPREGARRRHHVRRHADGAEDPASRPAAAAGAAGDRAHARRHRARPAARGRRDRSRARGARRQPDARVAFAAACSACRSIAC